MSGPDIGFALITHREPAQIARLVGALEATFPGAPIAIHHDHARCPLDPAVLPRPVRLVRPTVATNWGDFSLVEAALAAVRMVMDRDAPRWVVLLSGQDYPLKPASRVLADLDAGGFDAHLRLHPLPDRPTNAWERHCGRRYLTSPMPGSASHPWGRRFLRLPRWLSATPFRGGHRRCFVGGQWFSLNQRAAAAALSALGRNDALLRHYRSVHVPDESFIQTVLGNDPSLRVSPSDWRYVDWSAQEPHPRVLTCADLPALSASPAHFARKVDLAADASLFDELDWAVRRAEALPRSPVS